MTALATFGGPPGLIIGSSYFVLDALGAFDRRIVFSAGNSIVYYPAMDNPTTASFSTAVTCGFRD